LTFFFAWCFGSSTSSRQVDSAQVKRNKLRCSSSYFLALLPFGQWDRFAKFPPKSNKPPMLRSGQFDDDFLSRKSISLEGLAQCALLFGIAPKSNNPDAAIGAIRWRFSE
jgi:hypothetical protein